MPESGSSRKSAKVPAANPFDWALTELARVRPPSPGLIRARYRVDPARAAVEIDNAWTRYAIAQERVHQRHWELADVDEARTIGAPAMNPHLSRLAGDLERATESYDACVAQERDRGRRIRALRITERRGFTALRGYYRHKVPHPGVTPTRSVRPTVGRASARPRGAGRPRAAARASSRGGDSGDDSSGSEPPGETTGLPLHLAPDLPPLQRGATYSYACLSAEERGAQVEPVDV